MAAVRDGKEALDRLHAGFEPRVILLDLMMPKTTGWDFRREQLQVPKLAKIPVALMSGHDQVGVKAAGLGIREVLQKPIDPDQVLAIVERYCQRR